MVQTFKPTNVKNMYYIVAYLLKCLTSCFIFFSNVLLGVFRNGRIVTISFCCLLLSFSNEYKT